MELPEQFIVLYAYDDRSVPFDVMIKDDEEITSAEKALADEEDEQERIMRGEREETAEELGKKIAMRALFARMKARREKAKAEKKRSK